MHSFPTQWSYLQSCVTNKKIPQSMFFVGPMHCNIPLFVCSVVQLIFCKTSQNPPCLNCADCQMVARGEHPDALWVRPEKTGGAIKIDQIRELHHLAYLTPQRVLSRVIIIEGADRMNTASANALLKILEEPASHTIFILIAQQLSTVLPTVLSRCHLLPFRSSNESYCENLLLLGELYPQESDRAQMISQSAQLIDELIAVRVGLQHPCILASQWSKFDPGTLLWFLYLVYSQIQHMYFTGVNISGPAAKQLRQCTEVLNSMAVFQQMDKVNALAKKLSNNINMNFTLVLEDLLLSLVDSVPNSY